VKKVLDWAFLLWVVGATVRFAMTTWRTLHNPYAPGDDGSWFAGWVAVSALMVLAAKLFPPRTLWRGTLVVVAVFAASIFTLSHTWMGVVVALWLLLASIAGGLALLSFCRVQVETLEAVSTLSIPMGMGMMALAVFTLGLIGRLTPFWLAALLSTMTLFLLSRKVRSGMLLVRPSLAISREFALPAGLIALAALLNLTWAVAPEIQFDALNYHLAIPKTYLAAGSIVDVRFLHAYLSRLVEFSFAVGLSLGGPAAVKLFVYALGLIAAVATYALGKTMFDARVGIWAAAFFYTTPLVAWLTGTAYIDNIVALFCTAGLLTFAKWFQSRNPNWFVVASIIAGVAVGTKLNATFAFVIIMPIMAFGVRRQWRTVLTGAGVFLLVSLPTYALTWAFTGNPVFPLLNGIFKSPVWPPDNTIFNAAAFGLPKTLDELRVFPFRLTLDTVRFGEAMPRGAVGMSLLLASPFVLFFLPRLGRAVGLIVAAAAAYLIALFYTMQYARYYIAILPAVAVLGIATVFASEFTKSKGRWILEGCLIIAIVSQFPAFTTQHGMIAERFPLDVAFGRESREDFAGRTIPGYASALFINRTGSPNERILGVDVEYLRFYLNAPVVTMPISLFDDPSRKLSGMKPGPELATAIRQAGFTRLFVKTARLQDPPSYYPYLDRAFLKSYATLQFTDDGTSIYRFRE
jgi:4-amino-4-deoxy-L-arabinose transferase-like glycosyltransferase